MGLLSEFLYRRKLRSVLKQRQLTHRFLNIKAIQHIVVAFECEAHSALRAYEKEIRNTLAAFKRVVLVVHIKGGSSEDLSVATGHQDILISKEDLIHRIIPSDELISRVDDLSPDLFINLEKDRVPVIDFLAAISQAPMRVGVEGKSETSDVMINVQGKEQLGAYLKTLLRIVQQVNSK